MDAFSEIISDLKKDGVTREDVAGIKTKYARKYSLKKMPSNSEILSLVEPEDREILKPLLQKKPIRTLSGIAVVAVMARPYPCPGECLYCPKGEDAPQSYTGHEPAALRARRAEYDPFRQVAGRLDQLHQIGHSVEKAELIIMGGTFPAQDIDYQRDFVKECVDAMNSFDGEIQQSQSLEEAIQHNETANVRNVGITFETRPDFSRQPQVDRMLEYGGTRVELGVQTLRDEVYKKVRRGHNVKDVIEATRILKDSGIKVGYHMMPGLFSDFDEDLGIFKEIFENPDFRPDTIKIYPTLVIEGTELYDMWKRGEYTPYSDEEAVKLIMEIKKLMPEWVRTMRVQRDIPAQFIKAGVRKGDIGELAFKRLKEEGSACRCIRCRDVGHKVYRDGITVDNDSVEFDTIRYDASGGVENFLKIEDKKNDALIAYLRLRFPSHLAHRSEVKDAAVIREVRVMGPAVPIGGRAIGAEQHHGWGEFLLKKAEEISKQNGYNKILITSAMGSREYYRKFGYERVGPYMGKGF